MKNTIGSVAYHLGIYKATLKHFCKSFNLSYDVDDSETIGPSLFNIISVNKEFIKKYDHDYYRDKTSKFISEEIGRHLNVIELYLKYYHPDYYTLETFQPKNKYPLRYISSYKIDFDLGGDYSFLNSTHH